MGRNVYFRIVSCLLFLSIVPLTFSQTGEDSKLLPISILVSPRGSYIYIDNEFRGLGTNYYVKEGEHKISIRARGYKTMHSSLSVLKNNTVFKFTLTQVQAASVTVITEPEDAILYINGVYTGHTNKTFLDAPGEYEVHIEKQGYRSVDTVVTAISEAKNVVMCKLSDTAGPFVKVENSPTKERIEQLPTKELTEYSFTVTPPDAVVYIDNFPVTPGACLLFEGRHVITASKEGYVLFRDTLKIDTQKSIKKDVVLEKRKSPDYNILFVP